jgi:hypothetical protein
MTFGTFPHPHRSVGLLLIVTAVAACNAEPHARADESSPIPPGTSVLNVPIKDALLSGDPSVLYTLSEDSLGGPGTLGSVTGVAFDGMERLYVLDAVNARVMVFDSVGRVVRGFGRTGGGPAEFRSPTGIAVARDGRVLVVDEGRQSYVQFDSAGRFEESIPFPPQGAFGAEIRADPRGGWVGVLAELSPREQLRPRPNVGSARRPASPAVIARFQPEHSLLDTLHQANRGWSEIEVTEAAGAGRYQIRKRGPPRFAPGVHWDILPDGGVAVASEARFRITLIMPDGSARAVIDRRLPPRPVTPADRRREQDRLRERLTGGDFQATRDGKPVPLRVPPEIVRRAVSDLRFADVWPAIKGLRTTPLGTLWVERVGNSLQESGPIDILTAVGEYAGTVRLPLPASFSLNGRAAFIEVDGDGVSRIVVRQLPLRWR